MLQQLLKVAQKLLKQPMMIKGAARHQMVTASSHVHTDDGTVVRHIRYLGVTSSPYPVDQGLWGLCRNE
jgi:hypothetical protein